MTLKHFAERHEFASRVQWTHRGALEFVGDCQGFFIKRIHFSRLGFAKSDEESPSDFGYFTEIPNLSQPNLFESQSQAAEVALQISSGSEEDSLETFLVFSVSRSAGKFRARPVGPFFMCGKRL